MNKETDVPHGNDGDALCGLLVMLYEALSPEDRELLVDDLMDCHPDRKGRPAPT